MGVRGAGKGRALRVLCAPGTAPPATRKREALTYAVPFTLPRTKPSWI
jgi:hypothetical protein